MLRNILTPAVPIRQEAGNYRAVILIGRIEGPTRRQCFATMGKARALDPDENRESRRSVIEDLVKHVAGAGGVCRARVASAFQRPERGTGMSSPLLPVPVVAVAEERVVKALSMASRAVSSVQRKGTANDAHPTPLRLTALPPRYL
ncbi:hypothetical protein AXG93_4893s1030 [Marchantia polymorpha subsp. ruderalis]|uniref:Uncharacterized protein n=1 Tax=Marchantia polymorpha subsp. ruderalis TaxID=1480154 RepID=A0A176WI42_MARPO|nr:hypothetical protein AXG93_4893s1030 [Marchantia polymorpha subsp. ruderalis]